MDCQPPKSLRILILAVSLLACSYSLFADYLPGVDGAYATRRWILCFLLIATTLTILIIDPACARSFNFIKTGLKLAPLFLVLWLAAYRSPFAEFAYVEPLFYALFIMSVTSLSGAAARSEDRSAYINIFLIVVFSACAMYAAMSLNVYMFALVDGYVRIDHLLPWGFVNIRYWSHLATWLIPLLPLICLVHPAGKRLSIRCVVAFTAAVWWWLLFVSTSRGSFIGITLSVVFAVIVFRRQSFPWLRLMLLYFVLGLALWLVLSLLLPASLSGGVELREIKGHGSGRWPMWIVAIEMGVRHFPFGAGALSWLEYGHAEASSDKLMFAHPHNMYLLWIAEYGVLVIPAGLLAIASFIRKYFALVKNKSKLSDKRKFVLVGFTASVMGGFLHAGVSAVFIAPASLLVAFLVIGLFGGLVMGSGAKVACEMELFPVDLKPVAVTTFILVSAIWLALVGLYYSKMQEDLSYYSEVLREVNLPRFWYHGHFPRTDTATLIPD